MPSCSDDFTSSGSGCAIYKISQSGCFELLESEVTESAAVPFLVEEARLRNFVPLELTLSSPPSWRICL